MKVNEHVVDIIFDIATFCDIFEDCKDCPRYGDDCDGRPEDE